MNILLETQAGFRKGRGTIDNIYVLNHIIQKEIRKKGGSIFRFFMEIPKSAFDRIDRKILWKTMERRGIRREKERIKEIYENTKHVVRDNERVSEGFWTEKRLRQGCR